MSLCVVGRWGVACVVLVGCASAEDPRPTPNPLGTDAASTTTATETTTAATSSAPPTVESSASASASAAAASASSAEAPSDPLAKCEPNALPAGYTNCSPINVIDGDPCEVECWRERKVATKDRCCENPVHGAIFGKGGLLVEADACKYVDPNCAHTSDIKSVEAGFRFYSDSSPREVLLVQGGCEMRAMSHGYVPSGVAAWTGCTVAKRFRWNGSRFTQVP